MKQNSVIMRATYKGVLAIFSKSVLRCLPGWVLMASVVSGVATAAELLPPPYEVKDRHSVDMGAGQVSVSQTDISIGGSMGLSHSIGSFTSNFVNLQDENKSRAPAEGFTENYRGSLICNMHVVVVGLVKHCHLQVSDGGHSAEFYVGDDLKTFTPKRDSRYRLAYVNDPTDSSTYHQSIIAFNSYYKAKTGVGFKGFILSEPDGTLAYYPSGPMDSKIMEIRAFMSHIQKPNGLVIEVTMGDYSGASTPVWSVATNTGFQLRWLYQADTSSATSQQLVNLPNADSLNWSIVNPKYLVGINNALEFCNTKDNLKDSVGNFIYNGTQTMSQVIAAACPSLQKTWPRVTYSWPGSMPQSMYTSQQSFKVIDAENTVTEYVHTPVSTIGPGDHYKYPDMAFDAVPRLTQIKKAGRVVMNYTYATHPTNWDSAQFTGTFVNPGVAARLVGSALGNDSITYGVGAPYGTGSDPTQPVIIGSQNQASGYKLVRSVIMLFDGMFSMQSWDSYVSMDGHPNNRVLYISNLSHTFRFEYDDVTSTDETGTGDHNPTAKSHNVTKQTDFDVLATTASGFFKCNWANYKICNQATQITDPNGNRTDYEYDSVSGQPTKVTLPADVNGVRPQTRYTYTPKYAYYKMSENGSVTKAPLPVYLVTRESKCQKSAALSNGPGCSAANDEIITDYDYGLDNTPNNLLLRGVKVTATNSKGVTETRRICYSYDDYGNRIGETKPNANLNSCY